MDAYRRTPLAVPGTARAEDGHQIKCTSRCLSQHDLSVQGPVQSHPAQINQWRYCQVMLSKNKDNLRSRFLHSHSLACFL
jgi:hypothetical protein